MAARATAGGDDDYDAEIIEQILNKELKVDSVDSDHATPLHYAAKQGKLNLVKMLLREGAKLDAQTREGCTPLHLAAQQQRLAVCKYLLEKGADPNVRDNRGLTPMHCVCQTAFSSKILSLMISKGAKADAITKDGKNGLHLAVKKMQSPAQLNQSKICLILLANSCPVDAKDNEYLTPLHYAVLNGQLELCKVLIDHGAFVIAQREDGLTPLHIAAEYDHYDVAELLLEKGSYVNARSNVESTPLHVAAKKNHPRIAKLLLFVNADPDLRDIQGETALHVAAKLGHLLVVETMLKFANRPIDINARVPSSGATALYLAAKFGHTSIVQSLLDHGAFYNTASSLSWMRCCPFTPLALARIQNRKPVVKLIKKVKLMLRAAKTDDTDSVMSYIDKGASTNARDCGNGRCALHYAALNGNLALTEYLLSKGAKVDLRTLDGHTPLLSALSRNRYQLANVMIDYAATRLDHENLIRFLDAQTRRKQETALHKAVRKNQLDLVKLLIGSGATYNLRNKNDFTPTDLAKGELKGYLSAIEDVSKNSQGSRRWSEIIAKQQNVKHARNQSTGETALNWSTPKSGIESVKTALED